MYEYIVVNLEIKDSESLAKELNTYAKEGYRAVATMPRVGESAWSFVLEKQVAASPLFSSVKP